MRNWRISSGTSPPMPKGLTACGFATAVFSTSVWRLVINRIDSERCGRRRDSGRRLWGFRATSVVFPVGLPY
jgi:hypothetical protein